jgi:hypothetical protein
VIAHRKRQLATTFWSKAWSDNLERYADLANRLPVVRERLTLGPRSHWWPAARTATIADLVGSVGGLTADLSRRTKAYLRTTGYGRKRTR